MTRIISDKNGDYDLAHVIAVTKIPQVKQKAGGGYEDLPPTAKLHYQSGATHPTLLPLDFVRDEWLKVKAAEGHPADGIDEPDATQ